MEIRTSVGGELIFGGRDKLPTLCGHSAKNYHRVQYSADPNSEATHLVCDKCYSLGTYYVVKREKE